MQQITSLNSNHTTNIPLKQDECQTDENLQKYTTSTQGGVNNNSNLSIPIAIIDQNIVNESSKSDTGVLRFNVGDTVIVIIFALYKIVFLEFFFSRQIFMNLLYIDTVIYIFKSVYF